MIHKIDNLFPVKDGEDPRVVACLMHESDPAERTYMVKELKGPLTVSYGLCLKCIKQFQFDPTFKIKIDKTLIKKLGDTESAR